MREVGKYRHFVAGQIMFAKKPKRSSIGLSVMRSIVPQAASAAARSSMKVSGGRPEGRPRSLLIVGVASCGCAAAPLLADTVFVAALAFPADELPSPAQSPELAEISFGGCCGPCDVTCQDRLQTRSPSLVDTKR